MFDLEKQLSLLEVLTKRLAKLRRERETLQELMQGDVSYAAYNALMHSIWRVDRDIKDTQDKLQLEDKPVKLVVKTYEVLLTETHTYELEIKAESVEEAELLATQRWNSGDLVGLFELEAEVRGVVK